MALPHGCSVLRRQAPKWLMMSIVVITDDDYTHNRSFWYKISWLIYSSTGVKRLDEGSSGEAPYGLGRLLSLDDGRRRHLILSPVIKLLNDG